MCNLFAAHWHRELHLLPRMRGHCTHSQHGRASCRRRTTRRRCSPSRSCATRWAASTAGQGCLWTAQHTQPLWTTGGTGLSSCGASSRPESSAQCNLLATVSDCVVGTDSRTLTAKMALAASMATAQEATSDVRCTLRSAECYHDAHVHAHAAAVTRASGARKTTPSSKHVPA